MKVLLVTETLYPRGAETFVVRLANALTADHEVTVLNIHPYWSKPALVEQLTPNVRLVSPDYPRHRLPLQKLDGLFIKLKIDYSLTEQIIVRFIGNFVLTEGIQVVHSHLFKSDYYVALAKKKYDLKINNVMTNHGDYLLFDQIPPTRLLNYQRKLNFTLSQLQHAVNISDDQVRQFENFRQRLRAHFKIHKVLNGYTGSIPRQITKADLGIPDTDFVFGMVASGIKEKGWDCAVQAFEKLGINNIALLLVGEGEELERLKTIHYQNKKIIFAGYSQYPLSYINCFDVGILPSYYHAESLPTVIIEYMYMHKPVIATSVGEVSQMIQTDDHVASAGILIPSGSPAEIIRYLTAAMITMASDKEVYAGFKSNTEKAFQKFDMGVCVRKYLQIYTDKSAIS